MKNKKNNTISSKDAKKLFENTLVQAYVSYKVEEKQLYFHLYSDETIKASPVAQATFFKTRAGWGYIKDATVLLDKTENSVCALWFGGQKSSKKEYTKWGWKCFFEFKNLLKEKYNNDKNEYTKAILLAVAV